MTTAATSVLPNPVGRQTIVLCSRAVAAITNWYPRTAGYLGYTQVPAVRGSSGTVTRPPMPPKPPPAAAAGPGAAAALALASPAPVQRISSRPASSSSSISRTPYASRIAGQSMTGAGGGTGAAGAAAGGCGGGPAAAGAPPLPKLPAPLEKRCCGQLPGSAAAGACGAYAGGWAGGPTAPMGAAAAKGLKAAPLGRCGGGAP